MPRGRPSELTPEVQEAIVTSIREGNYAKTAALDAGVTASAFRYWMRRGEGLDPKFPAVEPYISFAVAVRHAEAECEAELVGWIYEKLKGDPNLAMKFLALRFPDRWGAKVPVKTEEENWKEEVKTAIEQGKLTYEAVEHEFGPDLAKELFASVGKVVTIPEQPNGVPEDGHS